MGTPLARSIRGAGAEDLRPMTPAEMDSPGSPFPLWASDAMLRLGVVEEKLALTVENAATREALMGLSRDFGTLSSNRNQDLERLGRCEKCIEDLAHSLRSVSHAFGGSETSSSTTPSPRLD